MTFVEACAAGFVVFVALVIVWAYGKYKYAAGERAGIDMSKVGLAQWKEYAEDQYELARVQERTEVLAWLDFQDRLTAAGKSVKRSRSKDKTIVVDAEHKKMSSFRTLVVPKDVIATNINLTYHGTAAAIECHDHPNVTNTVVILTNDNSCSYSVTSVIHDKYSN